MAAAEMTLNTGELHTDHDLVYLMHLYQGPISYLAQKWSEHVATVLTGRP